jgi:CubicO group peptidase (beta-lactamase class C family)
MKPMTVATALALCAASALNARAQPPTIEARVDTFVERQMRARRIPGLSLAVVRDGRVVYAKGYGKANLEWDAPATPETVYLLASVTKQFTATAIMMLVGEGKLRLDDPVTKWIADAPNPWKSITVRHLLTHTAGLKDRFEYTADGNFLYQYSTQQMLDAAKATALDFAPGEKWQYSDEGYFLLGVVVERASGKSYGEFLRDRIFSPAGMTSTSLHDWGAVVPRRADNYGLANDQVVGSRRRYQFGLVSHYGVQSTVLDLARYDSELAAGAFVPKPSLAEMWTPAKLGSGAVAGVAGTGYGYGWFLEKFNGHRIVQHGGTTGTCMFRLPDDGVTVILLTNLDQIAGSDPCFIARGVATRYVPAVSIVEAPIAINQDSARTSRVRRIVEAFARGVVDRADYTEEAYAALGPLAVQQGPVFAQLGPIASFELVAADELAGVVAHYRVRYQAAVVHFRVAFDARGRVASFQTR